MITGYIKRNTDGIDFYDVKLKPLDIGPVVSKTYFVCFDLTFGSLLDSSNTRKIRQYENAHTKLMTPGWKSTHPYWLKLSCCVVRLLGFLDTGVGALLKVSKPFITYRITRADYVTEIKMVKSGKGAEDVSCVVLCFTFSEISAVPRWSCREASPNRYQGLRKSPCNQKAGARSQRSPLRWKILSLG